MNLSIKNYGDIARQIFKKPSYGYENTLEGFKEVFNFALKDEDANKAYEILKINIYGG